MNAEIQRVQRSATKALRLRFDVGSLWAVRAQLLDSPQSGLKIIKTLTVRGAVEGESCAAED